MKKRSPPKKWMSIARSLAVAATIVTAPTNSAADAERGDQFFQTSCALCHSDRLGPGNTVVIKQGPTLVGVMGRKAGTSPHFGFTQALKDSGLVWNAETLDSNKNPQLSASIVEESGQKYLVMTVNRSAPAPGETYTVEVSSDLLTWASSPAEIVTLTETPTQLVVRDNTPIQAVTARFIRLRVLTQ